MFSRKNRLSRNESTNSSSSSNIAHRNEAKLTEIDGRNNVYSVAFLDGKHIVSGGEEGLIRRWRVEDGKEVGTPMNAGDVVNTIAVSQDGKWVVSGADNGWAAVWDAESHTKATEIEGHTNWVYAVDVSPDGTRIATGSTDKTACVWSLSTGQRLLGPLQHYDWVVAVKFSPDGSLIATATSPRGSIRVHDSRNGRLLVDVPIKLNSAHNQSFVWAGNSKKLFALSFGGDVICLDVPSGTMLSKWSIHSSDGPKCIALASNGTLIAASANSSVSFWDTTTHKQIGSVIKHTADVVCMAISANYDIAMGGGHTITLRNICHVFPSPYSDNISLELAIQGMRAERANLDETIRSLRAQEESCNGKIAPLEETIQRLRHELSESNTKIARLEETVERLRTRYADFQQKANSLLRVHEQKHQCEYLYAEGRIVDASLSLLDITNTLSEEVKANKLIMGWLARFTNQCISALETTADEASNAEKHDQALAAYSTAISLSPSTPNTLLTKWASTTLICYSVNDALSGAAKFKVPMFNIYRAICDVLEEGSRLKEAIDCFRQMQNKLDKDTRIHDERAQWELSFQQRCTERVEKLGDSALNSRSYSEAAEHFSTILSLDPANRVDILVKRSKARASMNSWGDALSDADEAIKLNPSSHQGYERRHAALLGAGRHAEAVEAFHTMLSKLNDSPDDRARELGHRYVDATPAIRNIVAQTILHMPRVLIDTTSGRLYDKKRQAEAFELLPIYSELVSSMTMELDYARIRRAVKGFYRYVMLSHTWESDEPLLQSVEHTTVYKLEPSPVNIKLQTFCSLAHSLGFRWAWSDTCCVDKVNNVTLQESLVAMFTWYRGSSLTVVYLRGVSSESRLPGGLNGSIWNTRAWTYQEYVAAKTVQFYTEDWKPYLGLTLPNHKESPIIISEMQQATGVSAQELAALQPGLDRVREKLYLASMRQTTLVEDIAYSLLGIFNAPIPVIYGEGKRAVGRLLEHILTGSSDVTILAWTGRAGTYNSCLPNDLSVYNQLVPPHIPQPIEMVEMDNMVTTLHSSLPDLSLAVTLYNRLNGLRPPFLASSRLQLPGIVFSLTEFAHTSGPDPVTDLHAYHVTTSTFGDVEIKTVENLTGIKDLCFVHPWIRPLLDQEFSGGAATLARTTQAVRLVARLRQPFGALLFKPLSRVEYRRVAADSLIMVQVREEVPLAELIDNIRMIEVQ